MFPFWVNKASFWVIKTKKTDFLNFQWTGKQKKRNILTAGRLGKKINE